MDFALTEEQEAVRALAQQIFTGSATVERVKEIEASADRFDRSPFPRRMVAAASAPSSCA
jgi:hypothetical protein